MFGIIVIQNEIGERKAYIGLGFGDNEMNDAAHIAEHGIPVPKDSVQKILAEMEGR